MSQSTSGQYLHQLLTSWSRNRCSVSRKSLGLVRVSIWCTAMIEFRKVEPLFLLSNWSDLVSLFCLVSPPFFYFVTPKHIYCLEHLLENLNWIKRTQNLYLIASWNDSVRSKRLWRDGPYRSPEFRSSCSLSWQQVCWLFLFSGWLAQRKGFA